MTCRRQHARLAAWLLAAAWPAWTLATGIASQASVPARDSDQRIDAASIRVQDGLVHYRLTGLSSGEQGVERFEARVAVDCELHKRVEYARTSRGPLGVRTSSGDVVQEVRLGTHAAIELDAVCALAAAPADPARMRTAAGPDHRGAIGTAFAIGEQVAITNSHVVRGCTGLRLLQDGKRYAARLHAADPDADLAALVVADAVLRPLPLAQRARELGEPVTVLGYPLARLLGDGLRVTTGIVSGLNGVGGESGRVQISAPVQPGNSGGPVLDEAGAVAGVVVAKLDPRSGVENVSFAIHAGQLRRFLSANGLALPRDDAKPARAQPLARQIQRAAPSVFAVECIRSEPERWSRAAALPDPDAR